MKKPSKVDKSRPLYAYSKTIDRFNKLKKGKTSDCLLTELVDLREEVNKRK